MSLIESLFYLGLTQKNNIKICVINGFPYARVRVSLGCVCVCVRACSSVARLLLYRRNNSNEFGETSASQCLNALKEPRFPPFCAVCNAKIISRVYDHQIYVERDDEIEALQLLPLFFSPPSLYSTFKRICVFKKKGGRKEGAKLTESSKRWKESNFLFQLGYLPTLICLSGAPKKRGVICRWKGRSGKREKKERRKRADISAFLPVKRDTLQPVEGGGKKGIGKKNRW